MNTRRAPIEWQTMLVVFGVFGGFVALTWNHRSIPTPLLILGLGYVLTWSGSLQHEIVHGHPTRWRAVNDMIGRFTLDIWMPFDHYRASHLVHHRDAQLTDPLTDPESYYVTPQAWTRAGVLGRALLRVNRTLIGRLTVGPLIGFAAYLISQTREVATGRGRPDEGCPRRRWLMHIPFVALTVAWLSHVGFPPAIYACCVFISMAGIRLRSFAEHRWLPEGQNRTATTHTIWPFALLFLNNNLHVAHHQRMSVAWYRLPAFSREIDADRISQAGGGLYRGYFDVARRYGVRPFCVPVFPGAPES
jgi:fatty acid desaturase